MLYTNGCAVCMNHTSKIVRHKIAMEWSQFRIGKNKPMGQRITLHILSNGTNDRCKAAKYHNNDTRENKITLTKRTNERERKHTHTQVAHTFFFSTMANKGKRAANGERRAQLNVVRAIGIAIVNRNSNHHFNSKQRWRELKSNGKMFAKL